MSTTDDSQTSRPLSPRSILSAVLIVAAGGGLWYLIEPWLWRTKDLSDRKSTERFQAIEQSARRGRLAVPELIEKLTTGSKHARCDAALALSRIGTEAHPAVPALLDASEGSDATVRDYALTALGRMGADLSAEIERIAPRLLDENAEVRATALKLLVAQGDASIPVAREILARPSPEEKQLAISLLLGLRSDDSESRAEIRKQVDAGSISEKLEHLALRWIIESGRANRDELLSALRSRRPDLIHSALEVTQTLEQPDRELLVVVGRLLTSGPTDPEMRQTAEDPVTGRWIPSPIEESAWACLEALGRKSQPAASEIQRLVTDDLTSLERKLKAIRLLRQMEVDRQVYVPYVVGFFTSRGSHWYDSTLPHFTEILRETAPEQIPAVVEQLRSRLRDPENLTEFPFYALRALGADAAPALPELARLFADPDGRFMGSARVALQGIGPAAASTLPTVAEQLERFLQAAQLESGLGRNSGGTVVFSLLELLSAIGPQAASLRPRILELCESPPKLRGHHEYSWRTDPTVEVRYALLRVLAGMGGADDLVLEGMREIAAGTGNPEYGARALAFLLTDGNDSEVAIEILAAHIDGPELRLPEGSASAWRRPLQLSGDLGAAGRSAIVPLMHAIDLRDPGVRIDVWNSLWKLVSAHTDWTATDPIVRKLVPFMKRRIAASDFLTDQISAIEVLYSLGPAAADALPELKVTLANLSDPARIRQETFRAGHRLIQESDLHRMKYVVEMESFRSLLIGRLQRAILRIEEGTESVAE